MGRPALEPRRDKVKGGAEPRHSLVALRAEPRGLVVLGAVDVGAVVEGAVAAAHGAAAALVHEVPVEAGVGPVLRAFVLHEERALLGAEFLQVPASRGAREAGVCRGAAPDSCGALHPGPESGRLASSPSFPRPLSPPPRPCWTELRSQ